MSNYLNRLTLSAFNTVNIDKLELRYKYEEAEDKESDKTYLIAPEKSRNITLKFNTTFIINNETMDLFDNTEIVIFKSHFMKIKIEEEDYGIGHEIGVTIKFTNHHTDVFTLHEGQLLGAVIVPPPSALIDVWTNKVLAR
jgi:hypothetical protein